MSRHSNVEGSHYQGQYFLSADDLQHLYSFVSKGLYVSIMFQLPFSFETYEMNQRKIIVLFITVSLKDFTPITNILPQKNNIYTPAKYPLHHNDVRSAAKTFVQTKLF